MTARPVFSALLGACLIALMAEPPPGFAALPVYYDSEVVTDMPIGFYRRSRGGRQRQMNWWISIGKMST